MATITSSEFYITPREIPFEVLIVEDELGEVIRGHPPAGSKRVESSEFSKALQEYGKTLEKKGLPNPFGRTKGGTGSVKSTGEDPETKKGIFAKTSS